MRVGFAGTPAFAAFVLAALLDAAFAVPLVLTQPDRPKGRGLKTEASPVKALAEARSLLVLQPATLKTAEARAAALRIPLDVLVVVAYGLLLPAEVLAWPRNGCLNIHASLLPRWRGAAPIERSLLAGDAETGVTIMQMDAGLDTGAIIRAVREPIAPRDTAGTLRNRLAASGAQAILAVLRQLARSGALAAMPQSAKGVTYAAKIHRADAVIDWRDGAPAIDRQVRAFNPVPGAHTSLAGGVVKVWKAEPAALRGMDHPPGTVLAANGDGVVTACGEGALRLLELQPAGGRRMAAAAFVAGRRLAEGARFDVPRA